MIELRNLSSGYHNQPVLNKISLRLEPGQLTVLIGPNGCGKSTLLKTAIGLMPKQCGEILLDGVPLENLSGKEVARRVSYLSQSRTVPDITVEKLVLHGRFPYLSYPRRYSAEDHRVVQQVMAQVGLTELAHQSMQQLSGGQRQQAYVAMALAQECDTVLMDEPTTYLDIAHQLRLIHLTGQLTEQGKAVVLVLHDLPLALKAADRVVVMQDGEIRQTGTPEQILQSGVIAQVFGVQLHAAETVAGTNYFCVL